MSQPVKLSDNLVLDARTASGIFKRSIAGQIEYWATLGRALDPLVNGLQAKDICQRERVRLSEILATVDTPEGKARVREYLAAQPFPHFEPTDQPGVFIRVEEDGTRIRGRIVRKEFLPLNGSSREKR